MSADWLGGAHGEDEERSASKIQRDDWQSRGAKQGPGRDQRPDLHRILDGGTIEWQDLPNGVFYLEASAKNADYAEQLIDAYVNKRVATVKFRIPGGWDPGKDPSAIVESIEA